MAAASRPTMVAKPPATGRCELPQCSSAGRHGRKALEEVLVDPQVEPSRSPRDSRSPPFRVQEVEPRGSRVESHLEDRVLQAGVSGGGHAAQLDRRQGQHVAAASAESQERASQKTLAVISKAGLRAQQGLHEGEDQRLGVRVVRCCQELVQSTRRPATGLGRASTVRFNTWAARRSERSRRPYGRKQVCSPRRRGALP